MAARMTIAARLRRKIPRVVKLARRRIQNLASRERRGAARLLLVVGSQRSGTRLPLQILDRSPEVATFSEGSAPYFRDVLLEPVPEVRRLLSRSPFPVVALKPICETHRVTELLDDFPGARAVWIFRSYQDAVNSASRKWKSGRDAVRFLAEGDLDRAGWRTGGLTAEKFALVRSLYSNDLSLHAANAIMWYLRNDLFFDLAVDRRPDVLLVRYEDLVRNPEASCARMFAFCGIPLPAGYRQDVYASSISKQPFPELPGEISRLCDALERRLVSHYENTSRGHARGADPERIILTGSRPPMA